MHPFAQQYQTCHQIRLGSNRRLVGNNTCLSRRFPDCADEIEHKVRLACGLEYDDDAPSEVELTDQTLGEQPANDGFDELYAIDGSAMLDDDE